jgi:hypothetical protein
VGRVAVRLLVIAVLAAGIGWVLNAISGSLDQSGRPAGLVRGFVQGVLMPMALPNLLVGKDVSIYALSNTGVPYKLGYTLGVNACGLVFFGFLFWRVLKWRRRARDSSFPE